MNLEEIFEASVKNLAEYEKKQLIILLTNHMISYPSQIETDVIYKRVINKIIEE